MPFSSYFIVSRLEPIKPPTFEVLEMVREELVLMSPMVYMSFLDPKAHQLTIDKADALLKGLENGFRKTGR